MTELTPLSSLRQPKNSFLKQLYVWNTKFYFQKVIYPTLIIHSPKQCWNIFILGILECEHKVKCVRDWGKQLSTIRIYVQFPLE